MARDGMTSIISDLRSMTETGVDDYRVNNISYWSNDQLQRILDNNRTDLKWSAMTAYEEGDGSYYDYSIGYGNLETTTGGTAIFIVQDLNGANVSSASYSVDYMRGVVTFTTDTTGTDYWVTGRSYDLNGAAAEVWERKLSHYSRAVDFSTDGHNISRDQLYQHAKEMAQRFTVKSSGGFTSIEMARSDTDD